MRLFLLLAVLAAILVSGCSDGKFNLLIVNWFDDGVSHNPIEPEPGEEPSSSSLEVTDPYSSQAEPSSSSLESSSSSEEEPPSSSSSGLPVYSSPSGIILENHPTLELDDPSVQRGWASRYWDGCKPTCSWPSNIWDNGNPDPYVIARNCDMLNKEMPAYYLDPRTSPDDPYNQPRYFGTGCAKMEPNDDHRRLWRTSVTYQEHLLRNPNFPQDHNNDGAHTCFDMIPVAINDTLAYAFGATPGGVKSCGKCFQIQFDGGWDPHPAAPRITHSALKGKTLIVMASNTGHDVASGQFDIMIPGGGTGSFDCFSKQLGKSILETNRGHVNGGLLSSCFWLDAITGIEELRDGGWNASLEEWQACLRRKCRDTFTNVPNDPNGYLLKGCLWHADWYMATDNPTVLYKEVPCPQYFKDKYRSTIDVTPPPGCIGGADC
ncbi:MAG: hypothetical protein LBU89_14770 [Fibromonadaceae bacterium]|jgi:hypothetical protein|nr:hypothetical protein [Fibromonadaceae bacterium]